ncbi:hypothetical protein Tco_0533670 [Tanacetum coccineum]
MNGKKPLNLDFNILTTSTCIDYNNGAYVAHPSPEAVKAELAKMVTNPSYLDKTPVLKNSFPVAWRILLTFVIQVLGENYSSTEQVNSIQQLITYSLITRTKVDIGEIIYSGLNENFGYLPSIMSNFNFSKDPSKVTEIELMAHMIDVNNQKDSVSPLPLSAKKKKGKTQTMTPTIPKSQGLEASGALSKKRKQPKPKKDTYTGLPSTLDEGTRKSQPFPKGTTINPKDSGGNDQPADKRLPSMDSNEGMAKTVPHPKGPLGDNDSGGNKPPADIEPINPTVADPSGTGAKYQVDQTQFTRLRKVSRVLNRLTEAQWTQHEEDVVSYVDLKAAIEGYYEENIDHMEQTDKVIDAAMNFLDKNNIARGDLLNALNGVTEALKAIQDAVKEDHATALTQEEHLASWSKSSTSMAWNLGPRMTAIESSQTKIKSEITFLKKDTSDIKSMMTEIYQSFKVNVEGENVTQADTEEPPSHTEGEHAAMEEEPTNAVLITTVKPTKIQPITIIISISQPEPSVPQRKGKVIVTNDQPEDQRKLVPASKEVRPDPDALILMPYEINGKIFQLTNKQIQAHLDKEENIKKAAEEAKLFEMTKTEVIKVVQEEAEKIRLDPKKV